MIDLELLFKNENTESIILFFAGFSKSIRYQSLDKYFTRYRPAAIETGEFMNTFQALGDRGFVAFNDKMGVIKGPNWQEPAFVKQKKYGIE